jgi:hypothetical protein
VGSRVEPVAVARYRILVPEHLTLAVTTDYSKKLRLRQGQHLAEPLFLPPEPMSYSGVLDCDER